MKKIISIILALTVSFSAQAQVFWFPRIVVPKGQKQMEMQDLNISVQITGNIASTTYDMTFFNPNEKTLEGEIVFPLTDKQSVVAMALDINGKMRQASAVDKDQARQIYEEKVRQGIDPALLEKQSGNQYKLRVYPFNPKGTRRVQITTEETLQTQNNLMNYSIPLTYGKKLKNFGIDVKIVQQTAQKPTVQTDLQDFSFDEKLLASFKQQDYMLNNTMNISVPATKEGTAFIGSQDNKNYFYFDIPVTQKMKDKKMPEKIAVVWDTSFSGDKRDIQKEKELLSIYLNAVKKADIELITFDMEQNKSQKFVLKKGQAKDLLQAIDKLTYDGATRLEKLDLSKIKADEILLFTDGIATIGNKMLTSAKVPVYAVVSADSGETGMLTNIAQKTFGNLVDLTKVSAKEALPKLTKQPLRLIAYKHKENVREVYPLLGAVVGENFTLSGLFDGQPAQIELQFGYDSKNIVQTKMLNITLDNKSPIVPRLWAAEKAKDLELDEKNNQEQILQLGKDYSLVTARTSLLVLDSIDDYLRYRVAPKDGDLLEKYNKRLFVNSKKDKYAQEKEKRRAVTDSVRQANRVKKWYEKDFEQIPPAAPEEPYGFEKDPKDVDSSILIDDLHDLSGNLIGYIDEDGNIIGRVDSNSDRLPKNQVDERQKAGIKLKEWSPNMPYIKTLRKATDKDLYEVYLQQKEMYKDSPAFFFDVVDEFASRGQKQKAVFVLSNLLELKPDDTEIMRIVAHKLLDLENKELAEIIFDKIKELRAEEPQSYRDLAMLYEMQNKPQKALDLYVFILTKKWGRFNEIKEDVFVEMNSLISRHKNLNLKNVPKDLIFNMPMDMRATLAWSADNVNVGLDVTDPYHLSSLYKEFTNNGGRHSSLTGGYGPESFMIKKAVEGKYQFKTYRSWDSRQGVVMPTVAWLDVYTNYGRNEQKHKRTLVRVNELKDNQLGSVEYTTFGCEDQKGFPVRYMDECVSCDDTRKLFLSKEKCDLCSNRKMFDDFCDLLCSAEKPMQSSVGNCYECNHEKALRLTEEECKKCPNREMKFDYCVLKDYKCPVDKPLREGIVTCQTCDYKNSVIVSKEDCDKCPNREMVGDYCALKQCPTDRPLQLSNGQCYDCNIQSADILSPEDCAKCPNRTMQGKYCVRKECSVKKPLLDKKGTCYSCDANDRIQTDKETCQKCPNRKQFGESCLKNCGTEEPLQSEKGSCYNCDNDSKIKTTVEECAKCPNRSMEDGLCIKKTCLNDKDIESKDGSCYACDYKYGIETEKEECAKCSNRYMMGNYCVGPCQKKNDIQGKNGTCYSCDEKYGILTDEKTCLKCPNRVYKNERCRLACPADKPIMEKNGYCYACDEESSLYTDEIECNKCPNRKQFGDYCKIACDKYEPMQDIENGACYDCDYERELSIPKSECDKCPNRQMVEDNCVLKCPEWLPLQDKKTGSCYDCDGEHNLSISKAECDKCPNRQMNGSVCMLKECPAERPLQFSNGTCLFCEVSDMLLLPKELCDKCPNRQMNGLYCILK